jgi:uncharacterized protein (TIGR02246 family)
MKHLSIQSSCIAILFALSAPAEAIDTQSMTPETFITRYEEALATQDWEAVDPLMHSNCSVTFSDGTLHRGKEAVEKAFRGNFAMISDETYRISQVHWIVRTDAFAVFTFAYDWSGTMSGQKVAGSGRGTSSLVKENGTWLLTSEHLGPKAGD